MGSALVLVLLAADPSSAVVLARRTGVTQAEAVALTERVAQALLAQKVPGLLSLADTSARMAKVAMTDATMCNGKPACHAEFGKQLEIDWLVLVSVSQIAGEQSLAIELARGSTGEVADNESLLLAQKGQVPSETLQRFAERMAARVRGQPVDAPKVTTLTPPVDPDAPPALPEPPKPAGKSHAASFVLGAAGLAAIGAGVGLLVSGLGSRNRLAAGELQPDGFTYSTLSGAEAVALNESANVQLGIAGAAAAVGLGLGTAAVVAW